MPRRSARGDSRAGADATGAGLRPLLSPTSTAYGRRVEARERVRALLAGSACSSVCRRAMYGRDLSTFYKLTFRYFKEI